MHLSFHGPPWMSGLLPLYRPSIQILLAVIERALDHQFTLLFLNLSHF